MKRNRLIAAIIAVLVSGTLLTGCKSTDVKYPKGTKTYTFTDDYGREVEVKKNIKTIVGSGPNTQMILCTVASDMLVGLNAAPTTEQEKYYPADFVDMPTLGQFYGSKASLNIENLIKASPDIIIDIGEKKEDGASDMDEIQSKTGIATVFLETSLDSYDSMYKKLGKLLGRSEQADKLAAYCKETSDMADKAAAKISKKNRKSVYFGVSTTGLNANVEGSIQADVIEKIGARNAIHTDEEVNGMDGGNPVDGEAVNKANPDVIVFGPDSPYDAVHKDGQWKEIPAIKKNHYYEAPGEPYSWMSSPPSVNQILGIRWLGKLVYPDLYHNDIRKDAKEFYKLFYHYNLTDGELNKMLAKSYGK